RIDRMRTVLVVLFDDVQSLDVTGPVEVFAGAERQRPGSYRLLTASPDGAPVRTSSGLTLAADHALDDAPAPHTLLVPGGPGARLLADAGLLEGGRVTTHWSLCGRLARDHPGVEVDPDPIFVRDGHLATSAGVTAGIDLALALVEEDLDRDTALTIARHLVV